MPKFTFSCHVPAVIDIVVEADSRDEAEEIFKNKCDKNEITYTEDDIRVCDLDLCYEYWVYDENGEMLDD